MLETAQVERRFHALFSCQAAASYGVAGGYRVEGCGRVAHFRCFDTNSYRYHHYHHQSLGTAVSEALVDGMFSPDTCVLEYTSEEPRRPLREEPAVVASRKTAKGPVVRTRIQLPGGYLALTGKPLAYAEHALIRLHSTDRLPSAPCSARLYHDGVPIPVEKIVRPSAYDVQLVIRVETLRSADRAVRFAGEVCGESFELDQNARTTLGLFEARFREELARSQAPLAAVD
jgi:hypothetical protein